MTKNQELAIVLMNEHRIYEPDGQLIDILFRQRRIFLDKLSETHDQAVKKVKKLWIILSDVIRSTKKRILSGITYIF